MVAKKTIDPVLLELLQGMQRTIGNILIQFDLPETDEQDPPFEPDEKPKRGRKAKPAPEPEPEDDEDEDDEEEEEDDEREAYAAELAKKTLPALRKMAKAADFDPEAVAEADKDDLIESLVDDKFSDDDEEDDEDDEDEDDTPDEEDEGDEDEDDDEDEEGEGYTRDDLEGKGIRELRKIAKEEYEVDAADLKGLDKDGIIDLLLEDEEEDDEDDDEEEDEEEPYDEDELEEMSLADLRGIAKDWNLKIKPGSKAPVYVAAILKAQDEE